MNGTEMNAPPMPTMPDITPISAPIADMPPKPGSCRDATGGRLRRIRNVPNQMNAPKSPAMIGAGSALATCGPASEPATRPGAIARTTAQFTAPFAWCARTDELAVNMIVAADVPIAIGTTCSRAKPSCRNTSTSTGTIVKPPPMPSSPARKPTKAPTARKMGSSARFMRA